jgi:hypothetical protein
LNNVSNSPFEIFIPFQRILKTVISSKSQALEALAIVKWRFLCFFENVPQPFAMFRGMLKEALPSWSFTYLSNLLFRIISLQATWNVLAFL